MYKYMSRVRRSNDEESAKVELFRRQKASRTSRGSPLITKPTDTMDP